MSKLLQLFLLVALGVWISRLLKRTGNAVRDRAADRNGPEEADFEVLDDGDSRP